MFFRGRAFSFTERNEAVLLKINRMQDAKNQNLSVPYSYTPTIFASLAWSISLLLITSIHSYNKL